MTVPIRFDNSYARMPERFFATLEPVPLAAPRMLKLNHALAARLGLDAAALDGAEGARILSGAGFPDGAEPIAMAYAGHQFGNFVPQLGDGRAMLLGEVVTPDGQRFDVQLKGSGPTPFSRNGDGRAALGPVLREYVVSEAMAALGVPTTRALAAVSTGESVYREAVLPGAVLARVAASHIRIGTFQYFAARGDTDGVKRLADHAILRHDPDLVGTETPYHAFFARVVARQAALVAQWMLVGFVHGVMNTDNMAVSGETIDYGPCAFLDAYDPATVFSSIDRNGRYAYANQPGIAQWNLTRLAECLLPLFAEDTDEAIADAQALLVPFAEIFETAHLSGLRRKLGLVTERDEDAALAQDLLSRMATGSADFTLVFRRLAQAAEAPGSDDVRALFSDPAAYDVWAERWRTRLAFEPMPGNERRAAMERVSPAVIPRNHRVEEVIAAAVSNGDLAPFERLIAVLSTPFEDRPDDAAYAEPPVPGQGAYRTFCGT